MNSKQSKYFYAWTIGECIKKTYIFWGTNITSRYDFIDKNFSGAVKALHMMYLRIIKPFFYKAQPLNFDTPRYVYEALENLIPKKLRFKFDLKTTELSWEYATLNIFSRNRYEYIYRIDLLLATLLFAEEFIFKPLTDQIVNYSEDKLIVHGTYVLFKVSRHTEKTYISIRVRGVMLLQYEILN